VVSRDPVLTQRFRLLSPAAPERDWAVLTSPDAAPSYLHGLTPRTCWSNGAPVEWETAVGAIPGQVLHADPPYRLSVTVEDCSGASVYLTWQVRAADDGTVIRLDVEESPAGTSTDTELEDVWLPVLARLGDLLREPVA
jgi:uncharacterized protein YndB with AHSA1/START domain